MATKQVTQYIIDCQTVDDFMLFEHSKMRAGSFVFVFWDEDYYRAIRPFNEDDMIPFLDENNKAPVGYGYVVGTNRVAMTFFDGQELIDNGTQ